MKILKVELFKEVEKVETLAFEVKNLIEVKDLIEKFKNANGIFKKMTSGNTCDLLAFEQVEFYITTINVRFYEVLEDKKLYKTLAKNKNGEWVVY